MSKNSINLNLINDFILKINNKLHIENFFVH